MIRTNKTIEFQIDDKKYEFSVNDAVFGIGKNEILSQPYSDITYQQDWYHSGYTEITFLTKNEFDKLKQEITYNIQQLTEQELNKKITSFSLESYHHFVKNNETHFKIVSKTRNLFEENVTIDLNELKKRIERLMSCKLTDVVPDTDYKLHIIIRINRPDSTDFNPPHKDIYEFYDDHRIKPKMINCWIPVAGVTENTALPIAPGSHLINENQVIRTFNGGIFEGNTYRVRIVKQWGNSNKLIRSTVKYGQVLLFSPYLIHGAALNREKDQTRVALELRLFEAK